MAAADIAPVLAGPDITTAVEPLLQALNDVLTQFQKGAEAASIPFTTVSKLGSAPLESFKGVIEQALQVHLELRVSVATNAITLVPIGPGFSMPPAETAMPDSVAPGNHVKLDNQVPAYETASTPASVETAASASSANKAVNKSRAKKKTPRPKNAFIIYRKEWHKKVVADHPELHNNDISVIIGNQWNKETKTVREKYQAMAAEEKRQHLIDNPGYQYQPRKPSEKKKRMTKNKLAKMRVQSADANSDAMQEIDNILAAAAADNQATVNTFQAPYRQGFPVITENALGESSFMANAEHEDILYNQLVAFNASQPATHTGNDAAVMGQVCIDGQLIQNVPRYNAPVNYTSQDIYAFTSSFPSPRAATSVATSVNASANNSELDRHQTLFDDALISDLFDIGAFDVDAE